MRVSCKAISLEYPFVKTVSHGQYDPTNSTELFTVITCK